MSLWLNERVGQYEIEGKIEWKIRTSLLRFGLFIKLCFNSTSNWHDAEQRYNKLWDQPVHYEVSVCYVL
jgi:hypothetical protein